MQTMFFMDYKIFYCTFCLFGVWHRFNIWDHITKVPACSSGTLTNVLPHRNVMPQTQDMTPHPITIYKHRVDLSLCYPWMWNVTQEYTTTHFNVLGKTKSGNPSPTFYTHQQTLNSMMVLVSQRLGRQCTVLAVSWTWDLAPDLWRILTPHSTLHVFDWGNPEYGMWILPNLRFPIQIHGAETGISSVDWRVIVISLGPGPKLMMDNQHSTLTIHTPHSGFPHSNTLSVECGVLSIRHKSGTCSMQIHYTVCSSTAAWLLCKLWQIVTISFALKILVT